MNSQINQSVMIAFILNELPYEIMSQVANAIHVDKRLARIHQEEKFKIDLQLYNDNMTPVHRAEFEGRFFTNMKLFIEV